MCERRKPPEAVERRDKLEESFDHNERCTDRHRDRLAADRIVGDRRRSDAGAGTVRGGETMKRVPTLMDEAEFREYLERQKKAVEQMKKDGVDYMSRLCRLWGIVTATAGEENEKCYMASQLDQIFDLAK